MFYVEYEYYDSHEIIAQFNSSSEAQEYAEVMELMYGCCYSVSDFSHIPLNPKIEGAVVMRKGKPFKHFPTHGMAAKYVNARANPNDYSIR